MDERTQPISRRGLFGALARPFTRHFKDEPPSSDPEAEELDDDTPKFAIIQGRFCLAYQGGFCFTCSERCPEPGAITTEKSIPTIHADICTGCGICHDLCPAPTNAILVKARPVEPPEAIEEPPSSPEPE